jgi:hypothetical protein
VELWDLPDVNQTNAIRKRPAEHNVALSASSTVPCFRE